jgi:hypothetical protein
MPEGTEGTTEKDGETDPRDSWPDWAQPFLDSFSRGAPNVSRAAKAVGIHRRTVYKLRDRDETFALAFHDAREEALDLLEETIYALGTTGLKTTRTTTRTDAEGNVETTIVEEVIRNPTLAMFFLKRWRPEYRETTRIEQSGPGGQPIQHEVTIAETAVEDFYAALDELVPRPA